MEKGKDYVYLVQKASAPIGDTAFVIARQTEGSHSRERELIDEQTKQGRIIDYGNLSESFEVNAYGVDGDEGQDAIIDAIENEEQLKVWKVRVKKNAAGKYPARFAYTIVESTEESQPTDGFVEVTASLQVIGQSQKGELDDTIITPELVEFATYGFEKPGEFTGEVGKGHTNTNTPVTP